MGLTGGDPASLAAGTLRLQEDAATVALQALEVADYGTRAAVAAGRPDVAGAADALGRMLAKAMDDTGTAIGRLAAAAGAEGGGLEEAAGS
ncbi:MAG: hypothetical protein ABSA93_35355 [Streptosporangiaceae bacterium]|jgi:hypothetical protein